MSTYEALRFLGLDYYATASDIKAAYRRIANDLRPDAEERMERLNRAYAALQHRVDNTPAMDEARGGETGAKPKVAAVSLQVRSAGLRIVSAGLRVLESWKPNADRLPRLRFSGVGSPRVGRVAAVVVVMAAAGYGIVHGAAAKQLTPTVVDAESVSASQVKPAQAPVVPVAAVEKALPTKEKKSAATLRARRAPALPSVDPVEAKAIGSACLAETGEDTDAYQACLLRTARQTPHAIHLD